MLLDDRSEVTTLSVWVLKWLSLLTLKTYQKHHASSSGHTVACENCLSNVIAILPSTALERFT